jgi:hypothetical protein
MSTRPSTTLAVLRGARDSQISFSVTHGWSAFGGADHGWQDIGLARRALLREEQRLGKLRDGSVLEREFSDLKQRWLESTPEGARELERMREELGI